jgi:acyl-CoA dehydrogenase
MILVPKDTPGVRIVRDISVFGYDGGRTATPRSSTTTCACRSTNMLLGEGRGFEIAQGRLGPGASTTACA